MSESMKQFLVVILILFSLGAAVKCAGCVYERMEKAKPKAEPSPFWERK